MVSSGVMPLRGGEVKTKSWPLVKYFTTRVCGKPFGDHLLRLECDNCDHLIDVAAKPFTPEMLNLVIRSAVRKGGAKAAGFINAIEREAVGTPLAAPVAKWKARD